LAAIDWQKKFGVSRAGFRDTGGGGFKHFWAHAINFFIYQQRLFIFVVLQSLMLPIHRKNFIHHRRVAFQKNGIKFS
jgi:hypothetical protein